MARNTYLLELVEKSGSDEFMSRHLIEAEDRQMVKYHFHRTLKDAGYRNGWGNDKHHLTRDHISAEIYNIIELSPVEVDVLGRYLSNWTKV